MATTADAGAEIEQDRMERIADMYSAHMRETIPKLLEAVQAFEGEMTYSSFLRIEALVDQLRFSMTNRTGMRTHSESFIRRHSNGTAKAAIDLP